MERVLHKAHSFTYALDVALVTFSPQNQRMLGMSSGESCAAVSRHRYKLKLFCIELM